MTSSDQKAEAHLVAGKAQFFAGEYRLAEELLRAALRHKPNHPDCLHYLGVIEYFQHDYDSARHLIERALQHRRKDPEVHANLGLVKQALRDHSGSVQCFKTAIRLAPAHAEFHAQLATALRDAACFKEAIVECSRAIALKPNLGLARFTRAVCRLLDGDWRSVWMDHHWRIGLDSAFRSPFGSTGSLLKPDSGKIIRRLTSSGRLLTRREQGIGDELFFLRFAPDVRKHCSWLGHVASAKLAPLLRATASVDDVFMDAQDLPRFDHDLLIGDLPMLLELDKFEAPPPALVLRPDSAKSRAIAERLRSIGPPPYIGITWLAGAQPLFGEAPRRRKAVPLDLFADTLKSWKGTILSLQRHPSADDLAELQQRLGRQVCDLGDINEDLPVMLALLSTIEEYVGVSNTNMHLRAGLGLPARVLVSVPPDWRWTEACDRSPWFPDFILYRESRTDGWIPALRRLHQDLLSVALSGKA